MVICGSYMFEHSVSRDIIREVALGKIATYICLTLVVKELKMSVDQGRVVTTLNIVYSNTTYPI